MGKLAKKVQGAIPVVSLVSKLLTPEGGIGVETLSYNEYCRIKLDAAGGTRTARRFPNSATPARRSEDAAAPDLDGVRGRRAFAGGPGDERRAQAREHRFRLRVRDLQVRAGARRGSGRDEAGRESGTRDQAGATKAAAAALEVCLGGVDGLDDAGKAVASASWRRRPSRRCSTSGVD